PRAPTMRNAALQPHATATGAMTSGATSDPTAVPLWNRPLPRPRSSGGRRFAVTRRAQGQLNASPIPSPARVTVSIRIPEAQAAEAPASDHNATATAYEARTENLSTRNPAGTCTAA